MMPANTAFDFTIKPLLDIWRVETRSSADARDECAQVEAISSAVTYTSLYGLPAVDVAMMPFAAARRTWLHARRDSIDDYKLVFQVSGNSFVRQDDVTTALMPGDFGIVDLTRPVELLKGDIDGRVVGLHLPRQARHHASRLSAARRAMLVRPRHAPCTPAATPARRFHRRLQQRLG